MYGKNYNIYKGTNVLHLYSLKTFVVVLSETLVIKQYITAVYFTCFDVVSHTMTIQHG